jgi:hypothetical protein
VPEALRRFSLWFQPEVSGATDYVIDLSNSINLRSRLDSAGEDRQLELHHGVHAQA